MRCTQSVAGALQYAWSYLVVSIDVSRQMLGLVAHRTMRRKGLCEDNQLTPLSPRSVACRNDICLNRQSSRRRVCCISNFSSVAFSLCDTAHYTPTISCVLYEATVCLIIFNLLQPTRLNATPPQFHLDYHAINRDCASYSPSCPRLRESCWQRSY